MKNVCFRYLSRSEFISRHVSREQGHMRLVEALATLYSKLINRKIDPSNEVLITTGAYGALFNTLLGHVDEGDEVIVIEPYFDSYVPIIKMAGGVPRFVQLRPVSMESDTAFE